MPHLKDERQEVPLWLSDIQLPDKEALSQLTFPLSRLLERSL